MSSRVTDAARVRAMLESCDIADRRQLSDQADALYDRLHDQLVTHVGALLTAASAAGRRASRATDPELYRWRSKSFNIGDDAPYDSWQRELLPPVWRRELMHAVVARFQREGFACRLATRDETLSGKGFYRLIVTWDP